MEPQPGARRLDRVPRSDSSEGIGGARANILPQPEPGDQRRIEVVMAQVGHVSPEMTRYYTHLESNAKHDAVAAVQRRSSGVLEILGPDL